MLPSQPPAERTAGWLGFVWLGAASLLAQVLLVREALFAFHGGEIGLGLFFSIWVAGIAAGAASGAAILGNPHAAAGAAMPVTDGPGAGAAGPPPGRRMVPGSFEFLLLLLVVVGMLAVGVMRGHRQWVDVPAGGYLPATAYVLLLLGTVLPTGWLTGFLFPIGLRSTPTRAGHAYALESFGSMVGGAAAAWCVLPHVDALPAMGGTGLVILLWATLQTVRMPAGHRIRPGILFPATALTWGVLLFSGALGALDRHWIQVRWESLATGTTSEFHADTPYHHITMAQSGGEHSFYLNGMYQGNLEDAYVDSLSAALVAGQHPEPREIFAIAPALYGPLVVLAGATGVHLTVLRLDDALDRALAQQDPLHARSVMMRASSIRLETGDPRDLLAGADRHPDLIWVTGSGPSTAVANRFYTLEFFELCARILAPGGALILSLPGAANVTSPEESQLLAAVFASLGRVFCDVRILPGESRLMLGAQPFQSSTMEADASSPLTSEPDSLSHRRARRWPSGRSWPAAYFARLLPAERVQSVQAKVTRDAHSARLNTDLVPGVFFEQLRRWDRLAGGHLGAPFTLWREHPWHGMGILLLILLLGGIILRRRAGQPALSLASTGFCGMGWSLLLLLLYQTQRGALYLKVGLVTGLFMLGLALGAWAGEVLLGRGRSAGSPTAPRPRGTVADRWLLQIDLVWILLLSVGMVAIRYLQPLSADALEWTLLSATAVGGLLTGLPFPLAVRAWERRASSQNSPHAGDHDGFEAGRRDVAVVGGAASAADHGGAILGALVTGTFLVPLIGFSGTFLLLGLLKVGSALGGLRAARRQASPVGYRQAS